MADKLSFTDHEKLRSGSRDRELQEQRKRKAAAFLTRITQSDVNQTTEDGAVECASNLGSAALFTYTIDTFSIGSIASFAEVTAKPWHHHFCPLQNWKRNGRS